VAPSAAITNAAVTGPASVSSRARRGSRLTPLTVHGARSTAPAVLAADASIWSSRSRMVVAMIGGPGGSRAEL